MNEAASERRTEPRSRGSVALEAGVLLAAAVVVIVWIIPAQTSGTGIGLAPGFLPTVCATAIGILVVLDGLIRLLRKSPAQRYQSGWEALSRIGSVAVMGAVILQVSNVAICALLTLPAGMLLLGERRWITIIGTTAVTAGLLALVFR